MSYLDTITLDQAKNYLRIDQDNCEDDASLTSMIETALRTVETLTNHLVYRRDVVYVVVDNYIRVYDHPIEAVVDPTEDIESKQFPLYTFYTFTTDNDTLTLTVGYDLGECPEDLRQIAFKLLDKYYYNTDGEFSEVTQQMIMNKKRFLL